MIPFRKYRGDADPAPFMGAIRSMSFHADAMSKRHNTMQRMSRRTPDGEVTLMRVGNIEYVDILSSGLSVSYTVYYFSADSNERRFKLLSESKRELADFSVASFQGTFSEGIVLFPSDEVKIGDLIVTISYPELSNKRVFYNVSTGLWEEFVVEDGTAYCWAVLVADGAVYFSVSKYSDGGSPQGNWIIKVVPTLKNGGYAFVKTEVRVEVGFTYLEENVFYCPSHLTDLGYFNILLIDKETGMATLLKEGYNRIAGDHYEQLSWASQYASTYGEYIPGTWHNTTVNIPSKEEQAFSGTPLSGVYNLVSAQVQPGIFGRVAYTILRRDVTLSLLHRWSSYLFDGTLLKADGMYAAYIKELRGFVDKNGKETHNLFYAYTGDDPPNDICYVSQNGISISADTLKGSFGLLPGDRLLSIGYLPGLEKNPEIAALLGGR